MAKVSMKARKEVLNKHVAEYRKVSKKEKGKMLDPFWMTEPTRLGDTIQTLLRHCHLAR